MRNRQWIGSLWIVLAIALCAGDAIAGTLKTHGIFSSNMVLQRDRPIVIWGWAKTGRKVSVRFGQNRAEATATGKKGRWEVTFPAQPANATGQKLTVTSGDESIEMDNILIGDVWVMNGQSNMAFGLTHTRQADMERAQAHLPLLRAVRISPNESYTLEEDLPANKVSGWTVCTPETASGISAIGYAFASRLQRVLQIPIGVIDNARGGASIESLVPRHKFADDPLASRYAAWVEKRRAEFDWDAAMKPIMDKWKNTVAELRKKGVSEDKLPPQPTRKALRSWNVPGRSPGDAASCYNGMFGVFKGLHIKGVLFHQGYNNAMASVCRPKRYRILMKLMVEGWREDFDDPTLPVGVIGFCAGSIPQTPENFEIWTVSPGAYIREAQRLGLADLQDPEHTAFLPAYDIQIPGLHPLKKRDHGVRAARWALNRVYHMKIDWDTASLTSAERQGDCMVLTFDKGVMPDDMSTVPRGFSIADKSGKFYKAYARYPVKKDVGIWNTANKSYDTTKIYVWSPLVKEPVAVRYAWATSPMGNLKVNGKSWLPLASFRTDHWDWPESEDPAETLVSRGQSRAMQQDAADRLKYRQTEQAKRAVEILERLQTLGRPNGSGQATDARRSSSAAKKTQARAGKSLPRVLLIGDSICGGYQQVVKRLLAGKADVVKNPGNAEYTGTGLKKIDQWLGDGKWDVIHFNWGLWDMYGWQYTKEDRSPAMYEKRLEALVSRLEKTGATLIWATTTPPCPGPEGTMLKRWHTQLTITPDIERQYQQAAMRVMKRHHVAIDDLHALVLPELAKYSPAPDNVHFTAAGYAKLGQQVADTILQQLQGLGKATGSRGNVSPVKQKKART